MMNTMMMMSITMMKRMMGKSSSSRMILVNRVIKMIYIKYRINRLNLELDTHKNTNNN
jgi:hypothetical protein